MFTYPLRALSKDEKTIVEFTINDGPRMITEEYFILTNRHGTPILKYNSILRGMDRDGLFEGDILRLPDGRKYVIICKEGFFAINSEKEKLGINELGSYKLINNIYRSTEFEVFPLQQQLYKFEDLMFTFQSIVGVSGNCLMLNIRKGMGVKLSEIQQFAGVYQKNTKLFFGDIIDNKQLTLKDGKCVLRDEQGLYDLRTILKRERLNNENSK